MAKLRRFLTALRRLDLVKDLLGTAFRRLLRGDFRAAADPLLLALFNDFYLNFLRKINSDGLIKRKIQGVPIYLNTSDLGGTKSLLMYDGREKIATESFIKELEALKSEKELIILNIGAYIGFFTVLESRVLDSDFHVYAFEPDPRNLMALRKNIEINDLEDSVTIMPVAASDKNGSLHLELADNFPGRSRILSDNKEKREWFSGDRKEIETRTVDSILEELNISPERVNVIRIDVEGHETHVLRGMENLLGKKSSLLLFLEIHNKVKKAGELRATIELLETCGFNLVSASDGRKQYNIKSLEDILDIDISERPLRVVLSR